MKTEQKNSQKFLQQRKFIMALPILALPFLTVLFWALGGGQQVPAQTNAMEKTGLNLELPGAYFREDEEWNKLSIYEKAERDSMKVKETRESDPYFTLASLDGETPLQELEKAKGKSTESNLQSSFATKTKSADPNEEKVNQKLEQLYRELNKAQEAPPIEKEKSMIGQTEADPHFSSDVQKLEQMMETMNSHEQSDPEAQKIGGMLDKILDIQHPERVRDRIREQSEQKKGQVFPVQHLPESENISLMATQQSIIPISMDSSKQFHEILSVTKQNSFYGLEDETNSSAQTGNAIEAVIHETQELVTGATIKMRLTNEVYINGTLIPKDEFVFGTCSINGERLAIDINSIRSENSLFPVSLAAYDLDGMEGIYIPGAIARDVAKQSSDQALQGMQFMSMDQSLSAQAASAGIEAAKGLVSKKVKMVKVTVKAGYKILLLDKQ